MGSHKIKESFWPILWFFCLKDLKKKLKAGKMTTSEAAYYETKPVAENEFGITSFSWDNHKPSSNYALLLSENEY